MSDSTSEESGEELPVTTMHVRRAVRGDSGSLDWVVARLTPLLVAQAEYRLGPALRQEVDPEDLANEAWVITLPKLAELGGRGGRVTPVLLKFLSTTMTYRINRMLRRRLVGSQESSGDDAMARLPDSTSGVITRAVRGELRDTVREQLDALEPRDREIIVLRGIEQHPAKTVAVMLELSPPAVDQRYSRALKRLRERLPDSVFDELE